MSQVKAIVLWGKANRGKTQTLNLAANLLVRNLKANPISKQSFPLTIENDHVIVLEVFGKKVGIITAGDSDKELKAAFQKIPFECDLYLCPSRTRGSSCKFLKNRFGDSIFWISKWTLKNESTIILKEDYFQNKANLIQAQEIVEVVKEALR